MANDTVTHPGADTIVFNIPVAVLPAGTLGTIVLNGTDIAITGPLTIKGPGADIIAVDGNAASRIFLIDDGKADVDAPVAISGLTLTNGKTDPADHFGHGGAIFSKESLSLTQVVVTGNTADNNSS